MGNLSFVLSGGSSNISPFLSLGGEPSSMAVTNGILNNLFDDISQSGVDNGQQDFRCIYLFNDTTSRLINVNIWMVGIATNGAIINLGFVNTDEVQRIIVTDVKNFSTVSYGSYAADVTHYESDVSIWADNVQSAIRSLNGGNLFPGAIVTGKTFNGGYFFDVVFSGINGSRAYDLLTCQSPVSKLFVGSPINSIAQEIPSSTTTPSGVEFYMPTQQSPISLPYLDINDGLALWVQRSVNPNTASVSDDGITIRVTAEVE